MSVLFWCRKYLNCVFFYYRLINNIDINIKYYIIDMSIAEKRLKKECEKIFEIYKNYTIEFCNDEKEDYYKLTVTINNNKW